MNAKEFAINHGEKIVVVLAAGLCGWMVIGTMTNQDIRPKDISMEKINEMVDKVESRRGKAAPPVLKTPPPYFEDMRARWSSELPSSQYLAWLSSATDIGPPDATDLYLYVYDLLAPKVEVVDTIGTVELTVSPPTPVHPQDPRVSGDDKKDWELERKTGKVINHVEQLGMLIEMKIGNGMWKPVTGRGVSAGGFYAFGKEGPSQVKLQIATSDAWVRHAFRARLVVKATGLPLDKAPTNEQEQTVLVYPGEFPEDTGIDWKTLSAKIQSLDSDTVAKFVPGATSGPGASALKPGELLYVGGNSDEGNVLATSSIRVVFGRALQNFDDPNAVGATVEVNKLIRDAKGENGKWLTKSVEHKLAKPGDPLDFEANVPDPQTGDKTKRPEHFETPFVLSEVQKDVRRVLYYEIVTKSRQGAGRARDLEVKPKEIQTETAVLENQKTGQKLVLTKLTKITKPPRPNAIVYPNFPSSTYDEAEEFRKNPANFQQWGLIPTAPIEHDPDTGPLEEWRKKTGQVLLKTDTKYYELEDGRLVYWENVNNTLEVFRIPGSEADKAAKPEKAEPQPEAPAPTGEQPKPPPKAPKATAPAPGPKPPTPSAPPSGPPATPPGPPAVPPRPGR